MSDLTIISIVVGIFFILSLWAAVQAIMETRTPQGAIAWLFSLIFMPFLTLPLYWIFGRQKFVGYDSISLNPHTFLKDFRQQISDYLAENHVSIERFLTHNAGSSLNSFNAQFFSRNHVELLINGEAAYNRMFGAIKEATSYVLVQFYIVQNDSINEKFKQLLIEKAKSGVRCYYAYDPVGSGKMRKIVAELTAAGVEVAPFVTTRGWRNWFQLNFRNHRKIAVVDGKVAFTGGLNLGDDCLGLNPSYGFYRDTNVVVRGPIVALLQSTFLIDWKFASGRTIEDLLWRPPLPAANHEVASIVTSPASVGEYATLTFLHLINTAKRRIVICNPYFVPDEQFVSALQLASLRGVSIKILTPEINNSKFVQYNFHTYVERFRIFPNIELHYYTKGFMHQKVMLIDDELSLVGSHNFDNRSFRLNFENSILIRSREFNQTVDEMIREDFRTSYQIPDDAYEQLPYWKKFRARACSLLSPIL